MLSVACAKPEADPAEVKKIAHEVSGNVPAPAGAPECKPADLAEVPTLTFRAILELAGAPVAADPEHAEWINPPALDAPAVRVLLDASAGDTAKRRAAATLVRAPAWLVYHIDLVNAPMALGVKELKIGTVAARAIRFDTKTMLPACVKVFYIGNDRAVSDAAIAKSDRPYIDPVIAQALRDDLQQQLIAHVPR